MAEMAETAESRPETSSAGGNEVTRVRPTPSMEDYLETIYELIRSKGYARVSDIALALNLQPSSVTRMVQRLDEQNFVTYERYRGLVLTERGEAIGKAMRRRHETLATFLRLLGVRDEAVVQQDVEGIEHHVSHETLERIERFVAFARANPAWMNQLHAALRDGDDAGSPEPAENPGRPGARHPQGAPSTRGRASGGTGPQRGPDTGDGGLPHPGTPAGAAGDAPSHPGARTAIATGTGGRRAATPEVGAPDPAGGRP